MGKALKGVEISDDVFKQTEAIIGSMTPAERERPEILNARRRERIAKGSGTTIDVYKRQLTSCTNGLTGLALPCVR